MNDDQDDLPQVIVCQGPPRCDKQGDAAHQAAKAGCIWCERHTLMANGEWQITKPGNA
ncbi:hypothetical protein NKI48_02980 [Mesorhizobium sp. M0644]|uniref:hypothetical protein n=1 Tax=Mesorhizobium sp. M0644 TaxID=2956979 RepID=UPI00333AA84E